MNKENALTQLNNNTDLGIAYCQGGGNQIKLATRREFLDWYVDTGTSEWDVTEKELYNDDEQQFPDTHFELTERSRNSPHTVFNRLAFSTYNEAQDAYYLRMEWRYSDDNGAGGVWHDNKDSIAKIESGEYDELLEVN